MVAQRGHRTYPPHSRPHVPTSPWRSPRKGFVVVVVVFNWYFCFGCHLYVVTLDLMPWRGRASSVVVHRPSVKLKMLLLCSFDSFSTKLYLNVPCDSPPKSYLLGFWNRKLLKWKSIIFYVVPNTENENEKLPISWKFLIVERNRVKFGIQRGNSTT